MRWTLILIFLAGCATTGSPVDPPTLTVTSKAQPLVINPPVPWYITWQISQDGNTNMPQDNVEFDVEKRDGLGPDTPWYLYCRTNQPPVPFTFDGSAGYFRVGDHWIIPPNDQ